MASPLRRSVYLLDNLEKAWRVIQDNGRLSKSEEVRAKLAEFSEDAPHKLRSLHARLKAGSFTFPKSTGIPIEKRDERGRKTGKFRQIVLASVEARVVQRAILNVLVDVPSLQPYVKTPFSFGGMRKETVQKSVRERDGGRRSDNPSAVPAAIASVLEAVKLGGRYVAMADIRAFFTRIRKSDVSAIVGSCVQDSEFMLLFDDAIHVELDNMAELRERVAEFPIEDVGVAQGNSLSPLLGNIVLSDFDRITNSEDCRCIRYIDDFLIIGPSERAVNAKLRRAIAVLADLGMELSPEKSSKGARPIREGFDFLGISIAPGFVRPSGKARAKLLASIQTQFDESIQSFRASQKGKPVERPKSLLATLKRVDGMIEGWGKHYWFCNDSSVLNSLDNSIQSKLRDYLGSYRGIRSETSEAMRSALMGVSELRDIPREPFEFPKVDLTR